MPFDWDKILGFGMRQDDENDPFAPTTEDRRQIMSAAMQGLGGAMVRSAMSPTWEGFGLEFSKGLGDFGDTQRAGYEAYGKKNRERALFDQRLQQEKIQSEQGALNLQQDKDAQQRDEDFRSAVIPVMESVVDEMDAMIANAVTDPSLAPKMKKHQAMTAVLRKQLQTAPALAFQNIDKAFDEIADITGNGARKEEVRNNAVEKAAIESGWVIIDEDGNYQADVPGFLEYLEKGRVEKDEDRQLQRRATQALITDRERPPQPRNEDDPAKPTSAATTREEERIVEDIVDLRRKIGEDGKIDPSLRILAARLGLDTSNVDPETKEIQLSDSDIQKLDTLERDYSAVQEMAYKNVSGRTNRINEGRGVKPAPKKALDQGRVTDAEPPLAKPDFSSMSTEQLKGQVGSALPPVDKIQADVKKLGREKVISILKKAGLKPSQIAELYGI